MVNEFLNGEHVLVASRRRCRKEACPKRASRGCNNRHSSDYVMVGRRGRDLYSVAVASLGLCVYERIYGKRCLVPAI